MASSSAIRIRKLSKRFGSVVGIEDISFEVRQGSFVTVLGPSGCGKTTLLRCIAGVEEPDSGSIEIGGREVFSSKTNVPPEERGVGMVYQSYALWPHMRIFDNVAYPLKVRHVLIEEIKKRVRAVLEQLEISDLAERFPSAISGGQQQRVALARALVYNPSILLLDEPLSNLDEQLRQNVRDDLKSIQRRIGITTIYVTHDRSEALSLSDGIVVLSKGKLMAEGNALELLSSPPNSYVASFLCGMLVLDGTVSSFDEKRVTLETKFGALVALATKPLTVGKNVKVCIRPSELQFTEIQGRDAIRGEVRGMTIEPDRTLYRVLVDNQVVPVQKTNGEKSLKAGDKVQLAVPETSVFLVEN